MLLIKNKYQVVRAMKAKTIFLVLVLLMAFTGCGSGTSSPSLYPSSAKAITAFSLDGVAGTINETEKTITINMPFGTDLTALVATFTSSGASVKVGSNAQISKTTANDFTSPLVYLVAAADGSKQDYTITVTCGLWIKKYPGNYTCFKLETSQWKVIITDPYKMNENVHADVVTVSHNHFDHNDFSHITGGHQLIDTAGSFNVQGIEIKGIAGHHNKGDNLTTNIIYVFNVDGLRCAQFASQGDLLTEEMYNEIGVIDILIIQICEKGKKKLIAETAAAIAQRLQAKIIIPAHGDVSQTDAFAAFLGADVEQNSTGKILVEKKSLAALQTPRVIVLDLP
jgi:hypothetical protein